MQRTSQSSSRRSTSSSGRQRRNSSSGANSGGSSGGSSHSSSGGLRRRISKLSFGKRTTWKRVLKTIIYVGLIALYFSATNSENKKFSNKNVLALLRALPMFWLASLAMPALNSGVTWVRYKRFITVAFIMAGVADALFQIRGVAFSGAMVTHGVAYMFIVAALAIRPFGKLPVMISTLTVVALVYLYVVMDVSDNLVRINLIFLAISVFLMMWRAIVRFQLVNSNGNMVILAGCALLAAADVILVFAVWKRPILNVQAVPFFYYAGMLVIDSPLQY
jgi:hypothetical protein